jgi:two-component system response regulator FixJ
MTEVNHRMVAIVDDDNAVRDSLRFLLEVIGHPVATLASAAEFLKAEIHPLACLILDHHMPEKTGLELAAGIPIILITGAPSPAVVTRAAEVGINWVLEKPDTEEDLLNIIYASALSVGVSEW